LLPAIVDGVKVSDEQWTCLKCGRVGNAVLDTNGQTLVLHVVGLDPHNCDMCAAMLDGFDLQTLTPGDWI
jgi:hypothetical protein